MLKARQSTEKRSVEFSELFRSDSGLPELLVTFLALLELAREGLVELAQQATFSPIYVNLKNAHLAA
jgi:segregation and condensation protein A